MSDSMKTQELPNDDAMLSAFLHSGEETVIVKAEDIPVESSGIDYKKSFFEPQVGMSYTVKLLTNPFGVPGSTTNSTAISHRKVYKDLPDPKRKGKKFHYVSSGNAKTCKALDLFFELNNLKKNGDVLAEQKISEFMGATNQGAILIQVLSSPIAEEIGMYRIMTFSTFGPNATIANLIQEKMNPTKEMIANGFEKEDVFNIFSSNALVIQCDEAEYEGQKGRDFSKTVFSKNQRSAYVVYEKDGKDVKYEFSKDDVVDGKLRPEAVESFKAFIEQLKNPDISIHNLFSYKEIGDPKNSEDTEKYLVQLHEKVDEIIPIIKNAKSIAEIKQYGVVDTTSTGDSAQTINGTKASDILKDSAPSELMNSILNEGPTENKTEPNVENTNKPSVDDILNS